MNADQAIAKMVRPGDRRPAWEGGICQILVTSSCNLQCFSCSQNSQSRIQKNSISLENFEKACECLAPYFGVVGVFGGCPTLHKQFPELCEILRKWIPFHRRGLWANNLFGHGKVVRETFNPHVSNINVHQDKAAADDFRREWPELTRILGEHEDSRHSSALIAIQDVEGLTDEQRWAMISECDVNRYWSSIFAEFRGELRFWACEIMASQAILHQSEPDYPDTGLKVVPGVWNLPMKDYADQFRYHCMACGLSMRNFGELANNPNGVEQVSKTHATSFNPKRKERLVELVSNLNDIKANSVRRATDYIENSHLQKGP